MKRLTASISVVAVGLLIAGCSTVENNHRQKTDMMNAYVVGDQTTAQAELDCKLKEPAWWNTSRVGTGDEIVWRLEAGTLAFAFGRYADAIREFGFAEKLIADYDERATVSARDVGSETASALSNLNALPYRGWCRDRMGLEIYKSLSYLGAGREDAFRAQVKRLRDRQRYRRTTPSSSSRKRPRSPRPVKTTPMPPRRLTNRGRRRRSPAMRRTQNSPRAWQRCERSPTRATEAS